ncbi:phage tail protein [Escherichia coli]|uniref:Phage tail protein n=6 Tax=Enterobacteriaceae TaxID=543 RepID=A0A376FP84_ECOLX|nr:MULTISPECIES: phage tail protein [Enterobacteriaceae]EFX4359290.1 phage tail protein [Shigella flexneri]EHD3470479.1 phage tail protein [Escherichia coli O28ac]EIQ45524.1 phage tail fiber repeat family protein [Shigella sonnei 3233-85]EEZ6672179.1 phage tail protein [Escherichia coli]EEZ6794855.1 phage tail protein [Escherichia coli]
MSTTTRKFKTIITDTGAKKLAQATAPDGKPVRLTHMAVGDGGGTLPTPDSKQTRLVHEVWRHTVNRVTLDATHQNHIIAELVIPPETGGFWIREIGVFDEHGDLIAVGNTAESYKPTVAEGSGRAQTFRTILTVSSTATVALTVDNTMVMATVNYVDDKLKEHEQSRRHPDASLTAKGLVQLSNATNSTSETLAATPKAVKAVMDETNKKAPLNSPALTGTPTTPTARQGTNNTQIASTAFVMAAIAALVDSSPDALNTLNELAAALGNDPNFATTMTNALAGKQPKDATLTALAGLATAADRFPYFTGNDVASLATLTKVGRDILAKSTVAAVIEYLGLQETVNKAGNAVQKNGDTLSGGLTFENDSILAWIRNTDWAKIGFKNNSDADTDSYMWFETGNNGNEYFKWRHRIIGTRPKDLMNLKWNALSVLVEALFSSEVKISTVNALRIFNSSFGAIFRRSEECLHIIPTRENEGENGNIGPLRPFTLNLRTGRISMGHGLDVTGDIFANRFAINSSTGMWIHMRDQNVILGRNAVSTDGAQALLRQDHADRKFMIGGLGNKQFGIYMINNSRTANGTDGQAYMDNNGNWLCGSQVIPGNYGNFDSRYVKDVRLGSQQYYGVNNWQTWNFQCPSGYVLTGINVQDTGKNSADNIAGVHYRPVQKYINGTWYNVASI